jgi:predicted metal-dependent phosphotriesterase family hydrolase
VLGDVDPALLGATDAHDHAFFASPAAPGEEFVELARAIEEVATLAAAGAAAFVDWTPPGLGRDLTGLRAVSEAAGIHIVAATGVHRDVHYAAADPVRSRGADELADSFVSDLTGEGVRCGVVKVGASYHRLLPLEETAFAAAAIAHGRTGAPICVHTERGTMGLAIVERLTAAGVPASSIVLAHLDRNPDAGEHAETASTGAWLELDGPGRTKYWPDSTILALIADLAARGHGGRVLLGGDAGGRSMLRAYGGGPGMDYLFARFKPRLERELGEELSRRIFVENPACAFGFSPPAA